MVSAEIVAIASRAETLTPTMSHGQVLAHLGVHPTEVFHAGPLHIDRQVNVDSVTYSLGDDYFLTINHCQQSSLLPHSSSVTLSWSDGDTIFFRDVRDATWFVCGEDALGTNHTIEETSR